MDWWYEDRKWKVLIQKVDQMAVDLTKLTAEVANNTSVTGRVLALLTTLVAEIAAIPPSTDPATQAALDALASTLTANDATIAAAVAADTPPAHTGTTGVSGATGP